MDRRLKSGVHDVETARKHYSAMRNLIINHRGGSRDERTLERLGDLSRKAAAAIDDRNGKSLLLAVDGYGADLFSESGHLKWASFVWLPPPLKPKVGQADGAGGARAAGLQGGGPSDQHLISDAVRLDSEVTFRAQGLVSGT